MAGLPVRVPVIGVGLPAGSVNRTSGCAGPSRCRGRSEGPRQGLSRRKAASGLHRARLIGWACRKVAAPMMRKAPGPHVGSRALPNGCPRRQAPQDRPMVLWKQRSAHLERNPLVNAAAGLASGAKPGGGRPGRLSRRPYPSMTGSGHVLCRVRQRAGHDQPIRMIGNRQNARRGIRRRRKEAVSEHQSGERTRLGESHPRWMHRQPIRQPDGAHVGLTNESSMDNRTRAPKHFADARPSTSPDHAGQTGRQEQGCGQQPGRCSSPSR
jgi:hypothetical protein